MVYFVMVGLIVILLCGFLINKAVLFYESTSLKALGTIVDLKGTPYEIYCIGPKNSDVVVFIEQAAGATFLNTYTLMKELSTHTRTCSYNRAGRMFSPPLLKLNGSILVSNFHSVIEKSNETKPLVLVGHQFGSLLTLAYTTQYPERVKGLILLDPVGLSHSSGNSTELTSMANFFEVLSLSGLMRVVSFFQPSFMGLDWIPKDQHSLLLYHWNQATGARSRIEEDGKLSLELSDIIQNYTSKENTEDTLPPVQIILPEISAKANLENEQILKHISSQTHVKTFSAVDGDFPSTKPKETEALITEFLEKLKKQHNVHRTD
eukprot:TRINITY_DN6021_c0_g1_i2.p1 TRINITY_DN6021_c0_g1~~TRINITY_DN6021_c0_g1_i2.p1  ORF type:complete len:320 (-),score=62.61 TRINITY_DN6021_c0_g1_i2:28-987(-)